MFCNWCSETAPGKKGRRQRRRGSRGRKRRTRSGPRAFMAKFESERSFGPGRFWRPQRTDNHISEIDLDLESTCPGRTIHFIACYRICRLLYYNVSYLVWGFGQSTASDIGGQNTQTYIHTARPHAALGWAARPFGSFFYSPSHIRPSLVALAFWPLLVKKRV